MESYRSLNVRQIQSFLAFILRSGQINFHENCRSWDIRQIQPTRHRISLVQVFRACNSLQGLFSSYCHIRALPGTPILNQQPPALERWASTIGRQQNIPRFLMLGRLEWELRVNSTYRVAILLTLIHSSAFRIIHTEPSPSGLNFQLISII